MLKYKMLQLSTYMYFSLYLNVITTYNLILSYILILHTSCAIPEFVTPKLFKFNLI